jgi:hypothetical protein
VWCGTRRAGRRPRHHAPTTLERAPERDLVGVLEVAADGRPDARRVTDLERVQQPAEVGRGRLAFEVRVRREDDLLHRAVGEALHELRDAQVVGSDAAIGLIAPPSTW